MKYTLEKITTLQACDAILAAAQRKKQNLERRRRNQREAIERYRQRMDQWHNESAEVQVSLAAFTMAYKALPAGRDKASLKVKVKRLEVREAVLEKKVYAYNVASLLVRELKYNRLDSQVASLVDYIAAVLQHRAMLGGATNGVTRGTATSYSLPTGQRLSTETAGYQGHEVSVRRHDMRRSVVAGRRVAT